MPTVWRRGCSARTVTSWQSRKRSARTKTSRGSCSKDGYEVAHFGLSQWNGVAIASAWASTTSNGRSLTSRCSARTATPCRRPGQSRHVRRRPRVWSLYVPNGRALNDEHMPYKLNWLDTLKTHAQGWITTDPEAQIALMVDWNIAPAGRGRLGHRVLPRRGPDPRQRAGTGGVPGLRGRRLPGRRPPARAPACTPTGTTLSCAFRRKRECGSTSSWPPPRSGPRDRGDDRPRGTEGQGRLGPRPRHRRTGRLMVMGRGSIVIP